MAVKEIEHYKSVGSYPYVVHASRIALPYFSARVGRTQLIERFEALDDALFPVGDYQGLTQRELFGKLNQIRAQLWPILERVSPTVSSEIKQFNEGVDFQNGHRRAEFSRSN